MSASLSGHNLGVGDVVEYPNEAVTTEQMIHIPFVWWLDITLTVLLSWYVANKMYRKIR